MSEIYSLVQKNKERPGIIHIRPSFYEYEFLSQKRDNNNRPDYNYGGVTIAYRPIILENGEDIHVLVEYGVSICSGMDRYVKAIGREKAEKALNMKQNISKYSNYSVESFGSGVLIDNIEDYKFGNHVPILVTPGGRYIPETIYSIAAVLEHIVIQADLTFH